MMTAIRCLPYLPSRPTWSSSHASKTFSTSSLECTGDYIYSHNFAITRDTDKTVNNIFGNARLLKVPSSSIHSLSSQDIGTHLIRMIMTLMIVTMALIIMTMALCIIPVQLFWEIRIDQLSHLHR